MAFQLFPPAAAGCTCSPTHEASKPMATESRQQLYGFQYIVSVYLPDTHYQTTLLIPFVKQGCCILFYYPISSRCSAPGRRGSGCSAALSRHSSRQLSGERPEGFRGCSAAEQRNKIEGQIECNSPAWRRA